MKKFLFTLSILVVLFSGNAFAQGRNADTGKVTPKKTSQSQPKAATETGKPDTLAEKNFLPTVLFDCDKEFKYYRIQDKDSIRVRKNGIAVATIGICEFLCISTLNTTSDEMVRWLSMPQITYSQQLAMISVCDEMIRVASLDGFTVFDTECYIAEVERVKAIILQKEVDRSR